jgi:hypothetical protein
MPIEEVEGGVDRARLKELERRHHVSDHCHKELSL